MLALNIFVVSACLGHVAGCGGCGGGVGAGDAYSEVGSAGSGTVFIHTGVHCSCVKTHDRCITIDRCADLQPERERERESILCLKTSVGGVFVALINQSVRCCFL